MRLTGIADEAAPTLSAQIRCHELLGWDSLELRNIDGVNICEIDDESFGAVAEMLERARMQVICFASPIASRSWPIDSNFSAEVECLERTASRMHRLGTRFIRIMSYPNAGLPEEEWRGEAWRRLHALTRIAEGEDIVLLHENCSGWGGVSPENQSRLLKEMASRHFRIVFDTANPAAIEPTGEYVWEFYLSAKPYIEHIHIKDCRNENGRVVATYPGEGLCRISDILRDCVAGGYTGALSIEPHMRIHDGEKLEAEAVYLEYGRKAAELIAGVLEGVQDVTD